MHQSTHKKLSLVKRLIFIILSVIVFLLIACIILFNYYKDDIGRNILLRVNKIQNGELVFEDISVNPFVHFPNVSLALKEVNYFEHSADNRLVDSIPIIELKKLFVAFDLIDLIRGNITASKIHLKNGRVTLVTYADSSLNLLNALSSEQDTILQHQDTIQEESFEYKLNLEKVEFESIEVTYNDLPDKNFSAYNINSIEASLKYIPDTISCTVNSDITIKVAKLDKGLALKNKNVKLETALIYDRNSGKVIIDPSNCSFDRANFNFEGYIDMHNDGYIDLTVKGNDKDFSILNLFLKSTVVENIDEGDLFLNGTIAGKLNEGIPQIECSFGIKDVKIQIPNTTQIINKLNLVGSFKSGLEDDFSNAYLQVEKITAQLPGGNLHGTFSVLNFQTPTLDVNCNMKTDIAGYENIFNIDFVESLTGNVEIVAEFNGQYDREKKHFIEKKDNSSIQCNSISFVVPEVTQIKNLDMLVRFDADSLLFENLELEIGSSDFKIVGSLTNIFYLFFDNEKNIDGKLHIVSNTYDFPDFFSYDQRIATNFPYRIKDIDLNVGVKTTTKYLSNFITTPHIKFDILHLDAEVEDFLPPVSINSGVFTLSDKDSSLNLDFVDFDIIMAGSKLFADVEYNSPPVVPDWLKVDVKTTGLNPQKTFYKWINDSISNYLNGQLDGSMHLDLVLSLDTINFDSLSFSADELVFVNSADTIGLQQLKLNAIDVDYDLTSSSNILENLNCELNLIANKFYSKDFRLAEFDYGIKVKNGTYSFQPNKNQFFSGKGEGLFVINPFADKPTFDITYKVQEFDVAELFTTFMEDTVITGKMDLDLAFTFAGSDRKQIEQSLNGRLLISGKDLTLHGINLDKVFDRFKRSQHFTFADVGAVMLMGPAGILITKGTDYASMIVLNHGESCEVVELSSDWEIEGGIVNLADVAFTTHKNRMAAKGKINLITDTLNLEIALLNKKGCSQYSQSIKGDIHKPEMGKVKVVRSLLAPITNIVAGECDVFYNGKVKQPAKK